MSSNLTLAGPINSAASSVWNLAELVDIIIGYTYDREDYYDPVSHTGTLAALAQVNIGLFRMVAPLLWRVVDKSSPPVPPIFTLMLLCFGDPEKYQHRIETPTEDGSTFRLGVDQDAVRRYSFYSNLVVKLVIPEEHEYPTALEMISASVKGLKLENSHFRNLHALTITPSSFRAFHWFEMCLFDIAHKVRHLTFKMKGEVEDMAIFSKLPELKLNLLSLSIEQCKIGDYLFQQYLVPTLKTQTGLRDLRVELSMSTLVEFFDVLHSLPRLKELSLETAGASNTTQTYDPPARLDVPPKRIMALHGTFQIKEEIHTVFRIASAARVSFDHLYCIVRFGSRPCQIKEVFNDLVNWMPDLQVLTYWENNHLANPSAAPYLPSIHEFHVGPRDLECLTKLSSLTCLNLSLYGTLFPTRGLLAQLAEGCPRLIMCDLSPGKRTLPGYMQSGPWSLNLSDVVAFALKMPALQDLGVIFDARKKSNTNQLLGTAKCLTSLNVGASPIDSPEYVCSILARFFPGLESIQTSLNPNTCLPASTYLSEDEVKHWVRVRELLVGDAGMKRFTCFDLSDTVPRKWDNIRLCDAEGRPLGSV